MIKQQAFEHFLKEEGIPEDGQLSEGRQTQIFLELKDCENIVDLLQVVDNNLKDPREFYKSIITDIVNASENRKEKQFFPDDSTVLLSMDRLIADYDEFDEDDQDIIDHECIREQGEGESYTGILKVKILCLATYTELGDPNQEYYDVQFEDGYILSGLSGLYLEKLEE